MTGFPEASFCVLNRSEPLQKAQDSNVNLLQMFKKYTSSGDILLLNLIPKLITVIAERVVIIIKEIIWVVGLKHHRIKCILLSCVYTRCKLCTSHSTSPYFASSCFSFVFFSRFFPVRILLHCLCSCFDEFLILQMITQ